MKRYNILGKKEKENAAFARFITKKNIHFLINGSCCQYFLRTFLKETRPKKKYFSLKIQNISWIWTILIWLNLLNVSNVRF